MRIVYVCDEYPPRPGGGIGTLVHTLAHTLSSVENDIIILELGERDEERFDGGVRVVTIKGWHKWGVGGVVNRLKLQHWLKDRCRIGRIDIVEVPDCEGLIPWEVPKCPIVVRLHQTATAMARQRGGMPGPGSALFERMTLRRHPYWIANSRHVYEWTVALFGIRPSRSVIVDPPVTRPQTPPNSAEKSLPDSFVLFAGRVESLKGAYLLAEAAKHFLAASPTTHLVYAGKLATEGGIGAEHRIRQILGPELSKRIRFLGHLKRGELFDAMSRAQVFACPSLLESFGLVVVEAMLAGAPVVVSNSAPFTEFVVQEKTGLLVNPKDPEEMAKQIGRLLSEPGLRRRLVGEAAQMAEQRFAASVCAEQSLSFYRTVLELSRGSF